MNLRTHKHRAYAGMMRRIRAVYASCHAPDPRGCTVLSHAWADEAFVFAWGGPTGWTCCDTAVPAGW